MIEEPADQLTLVITSHPVYNVLLAGYNNPMDSTVTNEEVAEVFEAIAELLEAQGENPFKIKAYRNAVRTLHELDEGVVEIAARGELRKVPGFGEAIAGKTQEILQTGTCELYERLKTEQAARGVTPIADSEDALADAEDLRPNSLDEEELPSPW